MLVPLGLWVAIIGYTVLYSGVIKLGGGTCSLAQAFRGQCVPAGKASSSSSGPGSSTTSAQDAANQQLAGLPTPLGNRSSGNQALA